MKHETHAGSQVKNKLLSSFFTHSFTTLISNSFVKLC